MAYRILRSKPIASGYQVELIDEKGRRARHNTHNTDKVTAEVAAKSVHSNDHSRVLVR